MEVEKKDEMILVILRFSSHHRSHLSKTVSSEKRRGTDKDPRREGGTDESVSIIFIADPHHANTQVSEDTIN